MNLKTYFKSIISIIKYFINALIKTRTVIKKVKNIPKIDKTTAKNLIFSDHNKVKIKTYIASYYGESLPKVKTAKVADISIVVLVKDDLERVKLQIEHHRKLGVKHLIYIDNQSTDGTFEWLKEQEDVSLHVAPYKFNDVSQNAWKKQIMDLYGENKWYINLDSDELFAYPKMEEKSIQEYISFIESKNIDFVIAPMIDMYSKEILYDKVQSNNIFEYYSYFDLEYKLYNYFYYSACYGGPRMRVLGLKNQLSKPALLKYSKDIIFSCHVAAPRSKNFETQGASAFLLHYKFLPKDMERFEYYVKELKDGMHLKENMAYINALKTNPNLSFYHLSSQKLNSSMDLLKINIANRKFFEEFTGQ